MLEVQKYLNNNSLEELNKEFGITVAKHESLPLAILNYDQLAGNKTHQIIRECRSLVLNSEDNSLISRSFFRFFNWGEVIEEQEKFNWNDFISTEKCDGSLVNVFFWENKWFANTRGSFGQSKINNCLDITWQQGFCEAMGLSDIQDLGYHLNPDLTYSCEFVSPYNKVVRQYAKPAIYSLSAFSGENELRYWEKHLRSDIWQKPEVYNFSNIDEIKTFLDKKQVDDPTFEGVVICDNNFNRWKIKSLSYQDYHKLKNNGNIFHPKNFLNFILNGTDDDLVAKFPEIKETVDEWRYIIKSSKDFLSQKWYETKNISNQKDFALAIKDYIYSSILFTARKTGRDPLEIFKESQDLILKKQYPIPFHRS